MSGDASSSVRFRLLGPVEVAVDGRAVRLGGIGSRGLVAMLLSEAGRSVSEARLIEALWGEDPPRSARNSLQSQVSRMRQRFGEGGGDLGSRLQRVPGGYRLAVERGEFDVARVESLLAQARTGKDGASELLTDALAFWRGPPLAELVELPGWHSCGLAATRVRLDELESTVRTELLEARLASGAHAEVLPELEHAAAARPLEEHPHRMLAVALYRIGRVTDALAALRRYRERLVEDAGLDPSTKLDSLEQAILPRPAIE